MTHPSGMNVCPTQASCERQYQTMEFGSFVRHFPILSRSITPGLQSVAQLICLFQEPTRASMLGACSLGVLLTILAARLLAFENTIASCFVPECWVGFLSVLRALSLECVRVVTISLADLSNQLSGHYRSEVDVVRQLGHHNADPRNGLHNFAFLYQGSDEC